MKSAVASIEVNRSSGVPEFKGGKQYLVLIDTEPPAHGRASSDGAFHMVSPKMVEGMMKKQKTAFRFNAVVREYVSGLDRTRWRVEAVELSDRLDGFVVRSAI